MSYNVDHVNITCTKTDKTSTEVFTSSNWDNMLEFQPFAVSPLPVPGWFGRSPGFGFQLSLTFSSS